MAMTVTRLAQIQLTVSDLAEAERFYADALGLTLAWHDDSATDIAGLLGAGRIRQTTLSRGQQTLVLQSFEVKGAPYPRGAAACDGLFQHFAMPVPDIGQAYARLAASGVAAISTRGPQQLPEQSGGAIAYKFRDPDGHPLELIQFPDRHSGGTDHSAIVVGDAERSIAFYHELGLRVAARQLNHGAEQDRLDGLNDAKVEVIALAPAHAKPHVELLAYQHPAPRLMPLLQPNDIAATRLVLEAAGAASPQLMRDPDGHYLLLVPAPS